MAQMTFLKGTVVLWCIVVSLHCVDSAGKIHRAAPRAHKATKNGVNVNSDTMGDMSDGFGNNYTPWFYAIPATLLVGLTGIFPLLVIPVEAGHKLREGVSADRLKLLLSFAVGGLLGDVFLHLLPETFGPVKQANAHEQHLKIGLWIIGGLLTFLVLEKIFQENDESESNETTNKEKEHALPESNSCEVKSNHHDENGHVCNGFTPVKNGHVIQNGYSDIRKRLKDPKSESAEEIKERHLDGQPYPKSDGEKDDVKVVGYLNLLANCIDNFTHGLAVSGSFLVSTKVGVLTTFAILLHEVPHEIGDFAILLKSGFKRWDAACGQIVTATGGLVGAVFGLVVTEAGDSTCWVLPFTSGGFIYIALVTIVPELLEEQRPWESIKQVFCLVAGIAATGLVSLVH